MPPVVVGMVQLYQRLVAPIMARMVSFTPEGAIPSGAPSGAAVLLEASASFQLLC